MNPIAFELYKEIKDYISIDINGNITIIKDDVPDDIKKKIEMFKKKYSSTK